MISQPNKVRHLQIQIFELFSMRRLVFFIFCLQASVLFAQVKTVTLSGVVAEGNSKQKLPYVNVLVKAEKDSTFISGTVTDDGGRYKISGIAPGEYLI
jgi:hypothetical protein